MLHRFLCVVAISLSCLIARGNADDNPLTVVVMDPLSKPLSCDCVKGYAQRDYDALGEHLEKTLHRSVNVVWFESLAEALRETKGKADVVIGKHSIVLSDEKATGRPLSPVAQLTGKDGMVTQKGLIVVRRDDPATELKKLSGYDVLFGPVDAEEKSSAAEKALKDAGINLPKNPQRFGACSEAANVLLEMPASIKAAAVISSYAEPLLEGCGSIQKGDLRVVGETQPVPFVSVFLSDELSSKDRRAIQLALLTAGTDESFLKRMETLVGFVPWGMHLNPIPKLETKKPEAKETSRISPRPWNQFRGPNRDGTVDWLPERLPRDANDLLWSKKLLSDGVGGLATSGDLVIVSGRTEDDLSDIFVALSLETGKQVWQHEYAAEADLDYGNSPRATPTIVGDVVVVLGATGQLSALELKTGDVKWTMNLTRRFQTPLPTWGFSGSPVVIENTVYLQVAPNSSLVAIDLKSGELQWKSSGDRSAYASMTPHRIGNQTVLFGVDESNYFARRADNGQLVWQQAPELSGDFGVPSPVVADSHLVYASENNGIQAFAFEPDGSISGQPVLNDFLIPDSHTPVFTGRHLLVAYEGLHSLDLTKDLRESWSVADDVITDYSSIIASESRAIVTTAGGVVLLVEFDDSSGKVIDQMKVSDGKPALLSHPAVHDDRFLIRVGKEIRCYQL